METLKELEDAIITALEAGQPVGWQVLDPEGNVVSSGPISIAEMVPLAEGE